MWSLINTCVQFELYMPRVWGINAPRFYFCHLWTESSHGMNIEGTIADIIVRKYGFMSVMTRLLAHIFSMGRPNEIILSTLTTPRRISTISILTARQCCGYCSHVTLYQCVLHKSFHTTIYYNDNCDMYKMWWHVHLELLT